MSLGRILIVQKGATVEELLGKNPADWLKPSQWHLNEEVGDAGNVGTFRKRLTPPGQSGEWVSRRDTTPRSSDETRRQAIRNLLDAAKSFWQSACSQSVSPPDPLWNSILVRQAAEVSVLAAQHAEERKLAAEQRHDSFTEAKASGLSVGTPGWGKFVRSCNLVRSQINERHEGEATQLAKTHSYEASQVIPPWRCGILLREDLLRAHLIVFDALVMLPDGVLPRVIDELKVDPLDSDESLLQAFHRRIEVIGIAVA